MVVTFLSRYVLLIFLFFTNHIISQLRITSPKTSHQQLPTNTKNKLIGTIDVEESVAKAARRYLVNKNTTRSIMKKYKATGSTENLPCFGCPPKLTEANKCYIVRTARKQRHTPFCKITNDLGLNVCEQTIQNVLGHKGYHQHIARKVPFLTRCHHHLHLSWALLYKLLTHQQ